MIVDGLKDAPAEIIRQGLHESPPLEDLTSNRVPSGCYPLYGFDWEDWGRLDAIEVLDLAAASLGTDPTRTFLTGHSMGGHGTWHLGVTFPGRFAAIAPSAGWISMWSYAGAARREEGTPAERLMARATGPSDTIALVRNLASRGVYVLHGDADDNVPVGQARTMRKILGEFHPDFAYHEVPGAGHWWGSASVDWPALFAFLEQHRLPASEGVRQVHFTTASPGVSARCDWATIEAQLRQLAPSTVHLTMDPERRRIVGTTENVARLTIEVGSTLPAGRGPITLELDGRAYPSLTPLDEGGSRRLRLARKDKEASWTLLTGPPAPWLKGPRRYGPFKDAFRNRFLLVYGTCGTPEENAWAIARVRFDAEAFGYRGNGSVDCISDREFLDLSRAEPFRDRGVILYGHAGSNAAWASLLEGSPVQVSRDRLTIGTRVLTGPDLACLFIRPRPGSDLAAVAVVSGTGMPGLRLTGRLPYFVSGVAYPDVAVFALGDTGGHRPGPKVAGFFGLDWTVEAGEFAWAD